MARPKFGVALAGGGPLGAIWELGALSALDEALIGLDLVDCDTFVGVSSGAFIAAGLANNLAPRTMREIFVESEQNENSFEPENLLQPAIGEYLGRAGMLPQLMAKAARGYAARRVVEVWQQLARVLPTGLFDNAPIGDYLEGLLSYPGRFNDFRKLNRQLFVVATDLDTSETIAFGSHGWDDVPISRAVQASTALPGLYPPVEVHGRSFVDGALMKTLHASIALEAGVDLLFCVNPLVPFDAAAAARRSHEKRISIAEQGLPTVMSQTFRSIIYSRMKTAMSRYQHEYPDADVLLFEPHRDDTEMFFTNIFSYAERRRLSEHAYQAMRTDLRQRSDELNPILARHGIGLDRGILADTERTLDASAQQLDTRSAQALRRTTSELKLTLEELGAFLEGTPQMQREPRVSSSRASVAQLNGSTSKNMA